MIAQLKKIRAWGRAKIGKARLKRLAGTQPCRIIIGTSGVDQRSWIPTDVEYLNMLKPEDWAAFFVPESIDAILAEHVWEHLTASDAVTAASNCFRYLKPGGYIRVAVPDGFHPDPSYIGWVKPGGSGLGSDDHKVLYDYHSFAQVFEKAGFETQLLEYFDESGKFHANEWDVQKGMVWRSQKFDERNLNGKLVYTSIIMDAWKDKSSESAN